MQIYANAESFKSQNRNIATQNTTLYSNYNSYYNSLIILLLIIILSQNYNNNNNNKQNNNNKKFKKKEWSGEILNCLH